MTYVKKKESTNKINLKKKALKKMNDKFLPKEGFVFTKSVDKTNTSYNISYKLKGYRPVLDFITEQIYNAIGLISSGDVTFEYYKQSEDDPGMVVVMDKNKFPNITNEIALYLSSFPVFSIDTVMDNMVEIGLYLNKKAIDSSNVRIIQFFEYMLNSITVNFDKIKKVVDLTTDMIETSDVIDSKYSIDDVTDISYPYLFVLEADIVETEN